MKLINLKKMAKPKSIVDYKKECEKRGETLGNFKSWSQKRASERNAKRGIQAKKAIAKINVKKVVKNFLKTSNVKETAAIVGLSEQQTSAYLKSQEADKLFKEIFKEIGVDKEKLAEIAFNDFLEYNRQKVKRSDHAGRQVEEMRDGKLAFKSLQFIADKLESPKNEIDINYNVNISDSTASLAVKQLINKIDDVETLREIKSLVENRISNSAKIIEVN